MTQGDLDALAEIFGSVKRTTIDGMRSEKSRLIALTVLHALQDRIIASFTPKQRRIQATLDDWEVIQRKDATLQDRLADLLAQGL